jgi:predicted transcriptional regulator
MCKILLSINPEHVENIMSGIKKYEFRKVKCREDVQKIFIYATSPIMKVVGEVDVLSVIEEKPEQVWEKTAEFSGISRKFFDQYFDNKEKAIAYQLGEVTKYCKPKELTDFGISFAPQSFVYV